MINNFKDCGGHLVHYDYRFPRRVKCIWYADRVVDKTRNTVKCLPVYLFKYPEDVQRCFVPMNLTEPYIHKHCVNSR